MRGGGDDVNPSVLLLQMNKAALALMGVLCMWPASGQTTGLWTFERALEYAQSHSPDARLAEYRIQSARAALDQAASAFWPRLQFQSSYTRTDNPMLVFGSILNQRAYSTSLDFNNVPDVDNVNVQGRVTMPLYAGGRNVAERAAAWADAEAARDDAWAVRNALSFEVARVFHTVLKTREFVRAAEAAVLSYDTNLAIAQKRLEAGTLLKMDVLDLEVRLAQAREDLLRANNAETLTVRALRNLLGLDPDAAFDVADHAPQVAVPDSGDFSRRPELAAAQRREQAAQAQVRSAKSGYLPRVSAFGSLEYDYGSKFNEDGRSYTVGGLAQWDLWDGFETRSRVRRAAAQLAVAREELRKLRLDVSFEVEQARLNLQTANQRLGVSEKAVAQASESLTLTRNRFEQGLVLATQLMDAETALVAARVRRAEAEADQRIAIAALRKALALPQADGVPALGRKLNSVRGGLPGAAAPSHSLSTQQ